MSNTYSTFQTWENKLTEADFSLAKIHSVRMVTVKHKLGSCHY